MSNRRTFAIISHPDAGKTTLTEKLLLQGDFGGRGHGRLKFLAVEERSSSVLRYMAASLAGRLGRSKLRGVHMEEADEISIEGDSSNVILDGEACITVDGKELARLGRGEFFGEISALLGEPPAADVLAATPLRCLVVPGPEVQGFLVANPQVMYRMLQAEARRLSTTLQWRG